MAFNKSELILDRVRHATTFDLETKKMLMKLNSIEEPSLGCTAEGEEVTDALGSVITTLYRAKRATFSGSNSLMNLDLAAAQYGAEKEVASTVNKIIDYVCETINVEGESVKLKYAPTKIKVKIEGEEKEVVDVPWIYVIEAGEIGTAYKVGAQVSETEFVISDNGVITLPTSVTSGKVYVEYKREAEEGIKVSNKAENFPQACELHIFAYFRDKCNENLVYSGKVIAPKAKLSAESIELALTSTGKHPFEFTMMKDYCEEDANLFDIIVTP